MRPDEFGAISGDPTFDSGPALNEFFAHCATHRVDDADISGDWYTKRPIIIGGAERAAETQAYQCGWCRITAFGGFSGPVVMIKNSLNTNFTGHLQVRGGRKSGGPPLSDGGSRWQDRANSEAIVVGDGCASPRFDMVSCQHAARDGFRHAVPASNGVVSILKCQDCGVSGHDASHKVTSTITAAVNLDEATQKNSSNQRAELTFDQVPDALNFEDYALIGGNIHAVMHVDPPANKVQVYPWVTNNPPLTGQKVEWIIGGGLVELTSGWRFDQIYGVRVAVALKTRASYPGSYGWCSAASAYANTVIGRAPNRPCLGGNIDVLYTEGGVPIQVLIATSADAPYFSFNISSAGPSFDLNLWHRLAWNEGTGQKSVKLPITANISGHIYGPVEDVGNILGEASLKPVPSVVLTGEYDNKTVNLKATPGAADKFGLNSMMIHAFSPKKQPPGRAPTGTWKFQPEPGFTVNNGPIGQPAAFSGFTKPGLFVCILDSSSKNWVVYNANR
ncbi:hypothetical protein [Streptomyces sp. NPDC001948]